MIRKFRYVDAMPGAGKTEYFVNQAANLLAKESANYILVYVAPTVVLLRETYRRVAAKASAESMARVRVVADPKKVVPLFKALDFTPLRDQPSTALNYLFGLITEQQYLDVKYASGFVHDLKEHAQLGTVIMTTHESFARVGRYDTTGQDFALLQRMVVIFDEARKCVIKPRDLKIPRDQWSTLWRSIGVETVESEDPAWRRKNELEPITLAKGDRAQHLFKVTTVQPLSKIKENFGVKKAKMLPSEVRVLLEMYRDFAQSGRGSIYILANIQIHELYSQSHERISVQVVMRPTSLFDNYQHVILTSAFFTDSQMYHFLKRDGHELISMLDQPKLSPALKNIKSRSERLRKSATRRLHVATLIRSEFYGVGKRPWENLSSYLMSRGMLLPIGLATEASGHLDTTKSHDEVITELSRATGAQVSNDPKLDKRLREYAVPPLWLLLYESARVIAAWRQKHKPSKPRSLLALNTRPNQRFWYPNGVRYLFVVKQFLVHGTMKLKVGYSNSDMYESEHQQDVDLVSTKWEARLRAIMYDHIKTSMFTVPKSPSLHGLNHYSDLTAFTHLAALNPNPTQARFYRMLIPDYNIDQDHSVENLVQTLYRTSLRNPKATEPVLMIVPYEASAILLAEKIGVEGFRMVNEPPLAVLHHHKERDDAAKEYQRRRSSEVNRKYESSFAKEIANARARLSVSRAGLKKSPDSQQRKTTVRRNEALLAELLTKAKLKGKR